MQNPTALNVLHSRTPCSTVGRFGVVFAAGMLLPLIASCSSVKHDATTIGTPELPSESLADSQVEIEQRTEAVLDATDHRRRWTKTLDELITVISDGERTDRHVAWFQSIRLQHGKTGSSLVASGAVAGNDLRKIANLHDDVKEAPFFREVTNYSPPGGVKKIDRSVKPPESFAWQWRWEFAKPAIATMPPSRPGGAGSTSPSSSVQLSEPEIRARYNELSTHLTKLPTATDFSNFMRGSAAFAASSGISLDRFVPSRSATSNHGLTSVRCVLQFRATLWQAVEFVSFVENHERAFHVRDFELIAGERKKTDEDTMHSCRVVVESFVYEPHATLEAKFGQTSETHAEAHEQNTEVDEARYEFQGRNGRRDVLVDPRPRR